MSTMTQSTEIPSIPGKIWLCGAITGATALMAMLDSTLANLALESIRVDLGADLSAVQWVVSAYLVAMAVSLPAVGWLGARFGCGQLWIGSTVAFTVASCLCAASQTLSMLVATRVLQGLAAGLMVPAGQAVLASATGPRQLGRLMGVLGLAVSLGPAIGPAIGGFLLEIATWPWLFLINVPIGIVALVLAPTFVPRGVTSDERRLDFLGLILLGIGIPSLLLGTARVAEGGANYTSVFAIVAGGFAILGYAFNSRLAKTPLLELSLFRNGTFASATSLVVLTGANMYGLLLLLPMYFLNVTDLRTLEVGWMLFVLGLGSSVALPVAGWATDRFGAGPVSASGVALLIATTLPFFWLPWISKTTLLTCLFLRGTGLAWTQMPAMTAAYGSVEKVQMGDASALLNIAQRIGGAMGAILLGIGIDNGEDLLVSEDFSMVFAGIMGISVAAVAPAFWLVTQWSRPST